MTDAGNIDRGTTRNLFANEYLRIHDSGRIVIPGFYGFTEAGSKRILGRGGSDRTGALAAVSLRSLISDVIYENWTDTDGIFSADPRTIDAAVVNPVLTRAEVREGAHGGSGILQGDTIIDLNGSDVAVHVRNTFNPDVAGTFVVPEREFDKDRPVVSVTGKELGVVTVQDMGMADDVGYVEAITSLVKESGLALEHMPTAQDALSMTFHTSVPEETLSKLADNIGSLTSAETASVNIHRQGVIYLVGEALRRSVLLSQVTARAAKVLLEDGGSGFETIISHPSSPSLAFLVDHHELRSGQQKLHHAFIEK
jgi:aspartate kinase